MADPQIDRRAELIDAARLIASDPALRAEADERLRTKGSVDRFRRYSELVAELASESPPPFRSGPMDLRLVEFQQVVGHAEGLWADASSLFAASRFATAKFLAVVLLEEIGKLGVAKLQLLTLSDDQLDALRSRKVPKALLSHRRKHFLVAGHGALINARLDRVLGISRIIEFLEAAESGALERERQAALYFDVEAGASVIPSKRVTHDDALFYVALAGECLAEVLGIVPSEWERLLKSVNQFEATAGLVPD